jgi:membrane protease YdiL (CAAX protease family)
MGDALGGNAVSVVLSVMTVSVVLVVAGEERLDDIPLWAAALLQVPLWTGLVGAVVWASRRKGVGTLRDDFGFWMRLRDIPNGIATGFIGQLLITLVVIPLYDLFGVDLDKVGETAERLTERAVGVVDVVLLVVIVGVGAPIVEELFYRGLWMRSIERRTGSRAVAVLGSSVLFGAMHLQLFDFPSLALAGLLFAWLAMRAGRLGPAIWAHVGFNLTAVIALLS